MYNYKRNEDGKERQRHGKGTRKILQRKDDVRKVQRARVVGTEERKRKKGYGQKWKNGKIKKR